MAEPPAAPVAAVGPGAYRAGGIRSLGFRVPEPPKRVRDAAANCRTGTAEAAEFSSRATAAAADFGGAVCNVECMFGMTGYGARAAPQWGSPWLLSDGCAYFSATKNRSKLSSVTGPIR